MNGSDLTLAIDLGTTYAKMACNRAGRVEVIPNREGRGQTPCAVWLDHHGRFVIGQAAKDALVTDPNNVHMDFVRNLGASVKHEFPRTAISMSPAELTAELLKSLRADAEQFAGREVRSVVITVPPNARVAQREATEQAASLAGFTRCLLVSDALAAAMAAGVADDAGHKAVLIYDFGGSAFSATLLRIRDGMIQVVAHAGDSYVGGTRLDRDVVEHVFLPALRADHPEIDLSPNDPRAREVYAKLQATSEAAKLRLTQANETSAFISRLCDGEHGQPVDFQCELTRSAVERLVQPLVERTIAICDKVLADSQIAPSEVSNVIPVGGMALMPFVRQRLDDRFGERTITAGIDPATAVVRGATIEADHAAVTDHPSGICLCDVVGQTISLALSDNEVLPLFEKETPLPASRTVSLHTSIALKRGQSGDILKLLLVEGESRSADGNRPIGFLSVPIQDVARDLPVGTQVEVAVEYNGSRQFRVSAYVPILDEKFERSLVLDSIGEAEYAHESSTLRRRVEEELSVTSELLARSAPAIAELEGMYHALQRTTQEAINHRSITKLRDCIDKLQTLQRRISSSRSFAASPEGARDPDIWITVFEEVERRTSEMKDPGRSDHLIVEAKRAISNNDFGALQKAVRGLIALLPPSSGLRREVIPHAAESGENILASDVDHIVQHAVEVFNRGQDILKHRPSEVQKSEILAEFEIARADLARAAELGSARARENLQIADQILAQVRDGTLGLSDRVLDCIQKAGEAVAREDWNTAVDKLRTAMGEARPTVPEAIRKNLAVALANRGVASANKLGSILTEESSVLSPWKALSSEKLNAAVALAIQAKRDLEEAAKIDSKSGHIQENLRKLNEIESQLSEFRSYESGTHSVGAPRQGPKTSWLKELKEKLWPTQKSSQPLDDDFAEKQDRKAATTKEKLGGTPLETTAAKGHNDLADSLLNTKVAAKGRGTPEVPGGKIDDVHFSVTSPRRVLPGSSFMLDVWAHLKRQRQTVIKQAREATAGGEIVIQSKGPIQVARGTVLSVLLRIDGLFVKDPEDTIYWNGEIGNARFPVTVPDDAKEGSRVGLATIYLDGLQIAKIHFSLTVGDQASAEKKIPVQVKHHRKAFASYASEDRYDVLTSIQGMQKQNSYLKVFYDEADLRSGANWEQELKRVIPESDVFYLFWSAAARASRWVDMEWRWALERRGIEFIDPVPLISPEEVPPPEELGGKHFKDWVLAYRRRRP